MGLIGYHNEIPYKQCVKASNTIAEDHSCKETLQDICQEKSFVAAKTIWTPVSMVPRLLDALPSLKVIFYTRDRRGTMLSRKGGRMRIGHNISAKLYTEVKDLCDSMLEDFWHFRQVTDKYPNRIMHLRYEYLGQQMLAAIDSVYSFIEHEIPKSMLNWVDHNMHDN